MRRTSATIVALTLTLGAAACSSGSDDAEVATTAKAASTSATSATASPATTEFIDKANAICTTMNEQSVALTKSLPHGEATTPAEMKQLLEGNAQLIQTANDQIRALPQPPADVAKLTQMYSDVDQMVATSRQAVAAIDASDQAAYETAMRKGESLQNKSNAESDDLGLTTCGSGGK